MGVSIIGTPDLGCLEITNLFQVEIDRPMSEDPDSTWFEEPTMKVDVAVMPDEAHVIKSIRKLGFNHRPKINKKYVQKWGLVSGEVDFQCIIDLINFQEEHQLQIAPHLSKETCVDLGQYAAMNVAPAVHVCSRETAAAIEFMIEHYEWDEKYRATAKFCYMVGKWHAYMSARKPELAFVKNNPAKNATIIAFLEEFCDFFATLKVSANQKSFWLIQKTVLLSTTSLIYLAKFLIDENDMKMFMGGRTLGDVVENLHSLIRAINAYPDPILYLRIVKGIALSQFLGTGVKKGSYGEDNSTEQLINFDNIKALCDEKKQIVIDDDLFLDEVSDRTEADFAYVASLANVAGYFLRKIINRPATRSQKRFKCQKCCDVWIQKRNEPNQAENTLIELKEWAEGALTKPSALANDAFFYMEVLFMTNRDTYRTQKGILKPLVTNIVENLQEKFNNQFPICHVSIIVERYINCRLHRWAKFMDKELTTENQQEIFNEAQASRTTAAQTRIN